MAGVLMPEVSPWKRRALTIPPDSRQAWMHLAIWELWMGIVLGAVIGGGILFVRMAPGRLVTVTDLSRCYAAPVNLPCERILYRGGLIDAAFTGLCGVMLLLVGAWLLWELWGAVEPKPITDDFLKLLNDSFGRNWRNPLTWPWARLAWAYGFTAVGATLLVVAALVTWSAFDEFPPRKPTVVRVDTSQTFALPK
jgi:hypothetical protein